MSKHAPNQHERVFQSIPFTACAKPLPVMAWQRKDWPEFIDRLEARIAELGTDRERPFANATVLLTNMGCDVPVSLNYLARFGPNEAEAIARIREIQSETEAL